MGHRSCIVRHRPTTLPGAPSRTRVDAHRRPGRADKKRGPSRSRTTYVVIIVLEGRRPDGSIGHFRPIFTPSGFGERLTAGPTIDRSTTTAVVFDAESGKSINEVVESSVHGCWQARAAGIPDKHRACESISEFEARSRILEEPGGPSTSSSSSSSIERSSGSINTLIPSSIAGLPVRSPYSIRFVKSIRRSSRRTNRPTGIVVVDLEKRFSIIARPILLFFHRLSNERAVTRVEYVSIFLSGSRSQFFQSAIPRTTEPYERIRFTSSSRGSLILVAVPFRAAAMTFRRGTSFR
ncbi:unnamed protein product [Lasius platythorax]|uniref:Uncharacterized protein n=1 Tax=Lasius platythorax TaxID=488582 RepID=A0AAV2P5U7_9HYME